MKHIIVNPDGVTEVDMTPEEIAEFETRQTADNTERDANFEKTAEKQVDAQSGNQKLLDLGLTQAEATALTGYTPPIEE
jgi:hypothetical protein